MIGHKRKPARDTWIDLLGGKANVIGMTIFAVVALAIGITWIEFEAREAEKTQYIDSWPITVNKHIEWTWAGKPEN